MLFQSHSAYLLQHAHNPVFWQEWNAEILHEAKLQDRLLIISIGYSACHWCHVMERESFENEEVAALMNEYYVSIKIDREEHPDLDHIYMAACQYSSGQGGWPLNVIALPDGKPVYAGTYFNKTDWMRVLTYFKELYKTDKNKVISEADKLSKGIAQNFAFNIYEENTLAISWEEIENCIENDKSNWDLEWGGSIGAPKFPMPVSLLFLIKYYTYKNDETIRKFLTQTAYRMAFGGLQDHIGGGFARYSVDKYWVVPHFEKMLYDNAQLMSFYAKMYGITRDTFYIDVAKNIHLFLCEEMHHTEGLYYSSLDADSEGVEGKYYSFTYEEVQRILGEEASIFCDYFNIQKEGNWENTNVLFRDFNVSLIISKYNIDETELIDFIAKSIVKIKHVRSTRIAPHKDIKIITSWNALMALGYMDLFEATSDSEYLYHAEQIVKNLWAKMFQKDRLYRCRKDDISYISATLDDAAFLFYACLRCYQYTFDEFYYTISQILREYIFAHYFDQDKNIFYFSIKQDANTFVRPTETSDNVTPAATSVLMYALHIWDTMIDAENNTLGIAYLHNFKKPILSHPRYYAQWLNNSLMYIKPVLTVCIMGEEADTLRECFLREKDFALEDQQIILMGTRHATTEIPYLKYKISSNPSLIYICANAHCFAPVKTILEALEIIKNIRKGN